MNKKIKTYRCQSGFTLFELLITIMIMSILVTFGFGVLPLQIVKARDARRKAELDRIKIALEEYYDSRESFPDSLPDCNQPLTIGQAVIYDNVPCDPLTKTKYFYSVDPLKGSSYKLYANLENGVDPSIENSGCLDGCGPGCEYNYGTSSTNINLDRCSLTPTPTLPSPI